jgi:RimJ/RimL family protein N-acetyltransferase
MPAALPSDVDTERLTLRRPRLEDFEDSFALWSDPVVVRYITGKPATREDVWARLLRYVGHWELMRFGFWTVREKSTGRFVGEVGLANFRREFQPPLGDDKEAGWVMAASAHGKGYATEAVRAGLAWAESRFGPERVVCIIAPENTASDNVARKCGFRAYGRGSYKGEASVMYERLPGTK